MMGSEPDGGWESRMANMRKYGSSGNSDDLKAADFKGQNLRVTIESVGTRTYPAREGMSEQTKSILGFVGKEKTLVLNGTNNDILCDAYGDDGDDWVGHEIGLSTKEYENFPTGWVVTPLDVAPPDFDDDIPF
jgi:hypothetical protein